MKVRKKLGTSGVYQTHRVLLSVAKIKIPDMEARFLCIAPNGKGVASDAPDETL